MAEGYFHGYDYYHFPEIFDSVTKADVEAFLRENVTECRAAFSGHHPANVQTSIRSAVEVQIKQHVVDSSSNDTKRNLPDYHNFVNREAFGGETTVPWRMRLWTSTTEFIEVHPTFLYESLWNLVGLLLIVFIISKARTFDVRRDREN